MKLLVVFLYIATLFFSLFSANPTTFAISDNVVIYQLQTGGAGSGTATEEIVILYNDSENPVQVTDWCVEYRSASYNLGFSDCIEPVEQVELWLEPAAMITFASESFLAVNPEVLADFTLSGGMSATGGHVVLVDSLGAEIDKVGWGGATSPEGLAVNPHISGEVLSRELTAEEIDTDVNVADFSSTVLESVIVAGLFEVEVIIDVCPNIPETQAVIPDRFMQDELGDCYLDLCSNVAGLQVDIPVGYEEGVDNTCVEIPLEGRVLFITELLPNPPSYDTDLEYIELYNPHNAQIDLIGYTLQVGPSYTKEFVFSDGYILPNEYLTFTDAYTNITLPNSSGVSLRLVAPDGSVVSTSDVYSNADDDVSWALVEDQWIYTNQITPASANLPYLEPAEDEILGVTTVLAPCPAGKYRNPETNRCRNIESAVSRLVPCDADEYRNQDTNRCRKIQTASALSPCPEGQERNPETNRCRKVSVLGISDTDELPTVTDTSAVPVEGTINWGIISLALFATLGYMAYEWRSEIGQRLVKSK